MCCFVLRMHHTLIYFSDEYKAKIIEFMLSTINQQLLLRSFYIQIIVLSRQGNTKMYRTQPLSSRSFESKNIRNWPSLTMV